MRTISLVCLFLFWGTAYGQGFMPGHEPMGFRGLKWGSAPVSGMYKEEELGDLVAYLLRGDDLTMGAATLLRIKYTYWRSQLQGVMLITNGFENWTALQEATFAEFGKGYQPDKDDENYVWWGDSSMMSLSYSYKEISTWGTLIIYSRRVTTDMETAQREYTKSVKEKAKTGKW
jgi:hypothetical protein